MSAELSNSSIAQIRAGLKSRDFSANELLNSYVQEIEQLEPNIQGFLHLDYDGARAAAKHIDERGERTSLPSLGGVVVAVKDNIAVRGMPATAGSKILEGYHPPYDATVVARLRKAGAIIIGKTNLDEFAMGASTEQSAFKPTRNPRDLTRVPGGSSGGSAAAVAARFCTVALGSDTGGSVRQPAAFCGVVGMRPTYGAVSRYGLIALASSMDVIGPLARSVADARELLAAIAGYDPLDATTLPDVRISSHTPERVELKGFHVGVPREYLEGELENSMKTTFHQAVHSLEDAGAIIVDLSLPSTRYAVPTYYIITPAEASSNLARYDGIRFGTPIQREHGHDIAYASLRGERFGPEPKRRILVGTFTLSTGYADRYYHTAQRVRTLIRQDFAEAFEKVDVLLTPTTPSTAFPLKSIQDPIAMYRQDVFLAAVSLAGLPALSLPARTPSHEAPIGIQLIGEQGSDDRLLSIAESMSGIL